MTSTTTATKATAAPLVSSPNIRKAAILLMCLPQELAADLLRRLSPKQIEAVSIEIAKLDRLSGDEQEKVINEFADVGPGGMMSEAGGLEVVKSLIERALGKEGNETLAKVRESIEALPFSFLKNVDPQNLLTFITDEHPQTIALILSHLPSSYGAEVIAGLPADRQLAVIRRIANMSRTSPEVVEEVEKGLENRMSNVMSQSLKNAGGVQSVAEILNVTDRATERSLLENLAQEDPDLVEEIRRLMFIFEDLTKLSDKDIQSVLKNVESSQWATALKGASEELKQKIFGNMSQRAAQMLREEMEYLGPVRLSEVEAIQQQVVDIVRGLEDAGELTINTGDEDEQFIQ